MGRESRLDRMKQEKAIMERMIQQGMTQAARQGQQREPSRGEIVNARVQQARAWATNWKRELKAALGENAHLLTEAQKTAFTTYLAEVEKIGAQAEKLFFRSLEIDLEDTAFLAAMSADLETIVPEIETIAVEAREARAKAKTEAAAPKPEPALQEAVTSSVIEIATK